MHCDTVRERLDALADGELGFRAAWPLRRHLAHCPDCGEEFASIQRLTARARAWQDVAAPTALRERMPAADMSRRPRVAWRPAFAFVGGTAVIAAVVLLTPGQPGRPTITFADVKAVLNQANIVSCDDTQDEKNSRYDVRTKVVTHTWFRRNPPAIASVSWPNECLPPYNTQPRSLQDTRGTFTYYIPGKSTSMTVPYFVNRSPGMRLTRQKMERLWPMLTGPFSSGTPVPKMDGEVSTPMQSGTAVREGRSVLTFTRHFHYPNGKEVSQGTDTIFVDPHTLHIIRVERTTKTGVLLSTEVITNFRYDAVPPPGTFDWSPPKGAKVEIQR